MKGLHGNPVLLDYFASYSDVDNGIHFVMAAILDFHLQG